MAEKRMFSKKIIDTDWFMDMPASSQNLYFHLSMRADDDGFVANPKRILKLVGASEDDYKVLISKKFIIPFESGVCVITDWRINNYLRNDRYTETIYKEEKSQLTLDENGRYNVGIPSGIPVVYQEYTLSNSNNNSNTNNNGMKEEIKNKEEKHRYGEYKHIYLTDKELEKLKADYGEEETQEAIKYLDEYIEMRGTVYKSHYLVIKRWVFTAIKEQAYREERANAKAPKKLVKERKYTTEELNSFYTNIDEIKFD